MTPMMTEETREERRRALDALMRLAPAPKPEELARLVDMHPLHANALRRLAADMLECFLLPGDPTRDAPSAPTDAEVEKEFALACAEREERTAAPQRPGRDR